MTDFIFYTYSDSTPIDIYVTRRNEIMIEEAEDNSIKPAMIKEAAGAKGFNHCFDIPSKREFSRSCHFNNILIEKWQENEDGDWESIDEIYLSDLRRSPAKLRRFLGE